ncbi:hypothetical protein EMIT0158MI4_30009 [Burkholderia ambifaria]
MAGDGASVGFMSVLPRHGIVSQMNRLYIACDLIGSMIIVSD